MYEIVPFVKIPQLTKKTKKKNKIKVGGIFVFPEVRSYVIQNVFCLPGNWVHASMDRIGKQKLNIFFINGPRLKVGQLSMLNIVSLQREKA
jgi:hypothetical protein